MLNRSLYASGPKAYFEVLSCLSNNYHRVLVVGHNPSIEELVEIVTGIILIIFCNYRLSSCWTLSPLLPYSMIYHLLLILLILTKLGFWQPNHLSEYIGGPWTETAQFIESIVCKPPLMIIIRRFPYSKITVRYLIFSYCF